MSHYHWSNFLFFRNLAYSTPNVTLCSKTFFTGYVLGKIFNSPEGVHCVKVPLPGYVCYNNSLEGFSILSLNVSNHLAANSSSIIRRSHDKVTVITFCILSSAVKTGRVPPTAMIQAWGGLITAENSVIPNIPRLEMVKEPPWNSCGCNLPSLARLARSCCKEKIQFSWRATPVNSNFFPSLRLSSFLENTPRRDDLFSISLCSFLLRAASNLYPKVKRHSLELLKEDVHIM